jgi:hypothetical protein
VGAVATLPLGTSSCQRRSPAAASVEALSRNKSINWRDSGSHISNANFSTISYQIIGYESLDTAKRWHELDNETGRAEPEMEMLPERC